MHGWRGDFKSKIQITTICRYLARGTSTSKPKAFAGFVATSLSAASDAAGTTKGPVAFTFPFPKWPLRQLPLMPTSWRLFAIAIHEVTEAGGPAAVLALWSPDALLPDATARS